MPYFPPERPKQPYQCRGCGGWFLTSNMTCCVAHPPGTCCHKYETRVESPIRVLADMKKSNFPGWTEY